MWYKWYVKKPKQLTWRKYKINLTENSLVITFSWRTKQGTFILAIKISQAILSSPKITHMEYEGIWYNRDNIIFRNFTWMKIVIESNCKSAFSTSLSAEKRSGVGTYFISWMWIYLFENAFQSQYVNQGCSSSNVDFVLYLVNTNMDIIHRFSPLRQEIEANFVSLLCVDSRYIAGI